MTAAIAVPVMVSEASVKTSIISTVSFETSVEGPKTAMLPSTKDVGNMLSVMMVMF